MPPPLPPRSGSAPPPSRLSRPSGAALAILGVAAFLVLAAAITSRSPKWLTDFDQLFYVTIAADLDRHGVFSNGVLGKPESPDGRPRPGMFFGPLYPALVFAAMRLDPRFAASVNCALEASTGKKNAADCEVYARPMHILHALLLSFGVLAVAFSAHVLLGPGPFFPTAGALATLALLWDAELFSFVMTESASFALYSVAAAALVAAWSCGRPRAFAAAGLLFGALCLLRPSFAILLPVCVLLTVLAPYAFDAMAGARAWRLAAVLALASTLVVVPWMMRNAVTLGKFGLTEEYGSAALIERFAFNTMTPREYALAFPYCLPAVGPGLVGRLFGALSVARFEWNTEQSFFAQGRARRLALVEAHGRLDSVIREEAASELRQNGWRHLLVAIPLAWCGMWVGGIAALVLVPVFAWACARAEPPFRGRLLLYSAPAFVMLGLHAMLANHYTRYNLILIGPLAVAGAWMTARLMTRLRGVEQPA